MDSAKNAISSFVGRSGQHVTDVDETVNPAVTNETIKPQRHEELTQAVDREVHQDHYHTTVQPIQHREVIPEQHTHQVLPTQEREFNHGNLEETQQRVATELGQFRDSSTIHDTRHTQAQAAAVTGEHVHHHVHETVQPVIHKETVQPEVVHTTIPIHETHHAPSEHHGMSVLPARSLNDFQSMGGAITGGSHSREEYEGHPRAYNAELQPNKNPVDLEPRKHDGVHDLGNTGHREVGNSSVGAGLTGAGVGSGLGSSGTSHVGPHSSGVANELDPRVDSDLDGRRTLGNTNTASNTYGSGAGPGQTANELDPQFGSDRAGSRTLGHNTERDALGAGAAGVGAGAVAAEHGHHHKHDHEGLQGTERNTLGAGAAGVGAGAVAAEHGHHHKHDNEGLRGTEREAEREPSNITGGQAQPTGTYESHDHGKHGHKTHEPTSHDGQSADQGKDPALEGGKIGKLTGSGVDGSHSAFFGLTPDGHRYEDTSHQTTAPKPADGENKPRSPNASNDTGSRQPDGAGVSDQLNDPRVAQKGHDRHAVSSTGSEKPGAGFPGGEQGSGTVKPGENNTGAATENKLNPRTDADGDGKAGVMD